ncbi:hypothetical protein J1614_010618 [Plenodomus biglobosus]|nr:hypothetical protein J1614_010618 [Plenodomus biglobosus]
MLLLPLIILIVAATVAAKHKDNPPKACDELEARIGACAVRREQRIVSPRYAMILHLFVTMLTMSAIAQAKHSDAPPKDCAEFNGRLQACFKQKSPTCPLFGCVDVCVEGACHKFNDWGNTHCVRECFVRDGPPWDA